MIYSLEGKISYKGNNFIVIAINGIAYQVFVTDFLLEKIKVGATLKLFTYLQLRENTTIELYGFESQEELEYFNRLNGVSGIGPKSAMNVLSLVKIRDLKRAIFEENLEILTKVSGIGKKIAERIILELKGKIEKTAQFGSQDDTLVIEALESMGYPLAHAREVIKQIPPEIQDTKKRIKEALKILSKK